MEEWIRISYAPSYAVSSLGRVMNVYTDKILKPGFSNGYLFVNVRDDGKSFKRKIHRLVAEAFCHGYEPGLEVNHIDGDKLNNEASNLEWTTHQKNIQHAFRTGLSVSGRRVPVRIIETGEIFESQSACAEAIGGYQSSVNNVLKGKQTQHRGYTFEYAP